MKIVDLRTFLGVQDGTLYRKYTPCSFEELLIFRGRTGQRDFFYEDLEHPMGASSTDKFFDILDDAQTNGTSFKIEYGYTGRDGCYDDGQLFLIYENDDVIELIEKLKSIVK